MILTQADQFPWRVAEMRKQIAADSADRVDPLDCIDEGRPFTDAEHRQLSHLLELAGSITWGGDSARGHGQWRIYVQRRWRRQPLRNGVR